MKLFASSVGFTAVLIICPALPSGSFVCILIWSKSIGLFYGGEKTPNLLSLKNGTEGLALGMLAPSPMGTVISILCFLILSSGLGFMAGFHFLFSC